MILARVFHWEGAIISNLATVDVKQNVYLLTIGRGDMPEGSLAISLCFTVHAMLGPKNI